MLRSSNAKVEFQRIVKGKNFMTPTLVGFYYQGEYAVEISKGRGFYDDTIYGVTVVNTLTKEKEDELSHMFYSLAEAKAYVKGL